MNPENEIRYFELCPVCGMEHEPSEVGEPCQDCADLEGFYFVVYKDVYQLAECSIEENEHIYFTYSEKEIVSKKDLQYISPKLSRIEDQPDLKYVSDQFGQFLNDYRPIKTDIKSIYIAAFQAFVDDAFNS